MCGPLSLQTLNGVLEIFEVYRSLPLMSLQDAALLEREGQQNYLRLIFQRNEVKIKCSEDDSASQLHRIIIASACVPVCHLHVSVCLLTGTPSPADRDECVVRSRQQQSHLLSGSSSTGRLQQFPSLSPGVAQRADGDDRDAAQGLTRYRWLDHLFVTLRLRPQEVYQPLENQGGGLGRWARTGEVSKVGQGDVLRRWGSSVS